VLNLPAYISSRIPSDERVIYRVLAKNIVLSIQDLVKGTKVIEYRKILERTQWLKKEQILHLQQGRLRALLKHSYENVPYYHRLFKERGLTPSDIKTVEDLKKLPILRKTAIRRMPQQLTARNIPKRDTVLCQTTGTTAQPLKFYRSREDVSWGRAAMYRAYGWALYELGEKYALIWGFHPEELKDLLFRVNNLFERQIALLNADDLSEKSIRPFVQKLERFRPRFLRGYSSCIYMLAKYLSAKRISPPNFKAIFSTAAILLPSQRRVIEKAFGCEVYDFYGSQEVPSMASECGKHSGYHIQAENVAMEFIKDGEPVAEGETGAILVTSLHNYAMPFIRYDIGDTGKPSDEICPCGRGLPLIKSLEGRTYEWFVTGDGSLIALKDLDVFFEDLPVKMFQIIQRSYDEIIIKIVKDDGYSERDTDFIINNITCFQKPVKVEVEIVESIPSARLGKKSNLISKIPTYDWVPWECATVGPSH